eukprot:CAMPEP_0202480160 /NCGR_PEP_ID=MMETSP1361-20130828/260_1 /ASSEMBLY_ACC=CAM_ASM_000849 /TAXON_ID=210615 /ORGANISM="Staurosira complex sp., Strain CCMP2646" /LENGTH=190 /DNA_ID=CAMNT_0049107573 /DNA_START=66 /DNA_END=638 /DNA_ORIENTATION=+
MPPSLKSGNLCCGPALFSTAAFILSLFANTRCNLMTVSVTDPVFSWPFQATSFGLYCYTAQNGVFYDTRDLTFDSKFEASRALGTTTMALGFCVWLFYLFAGCCRFGPLTFRIVGFFCFCCCIFQSLVFLVKKSEVCEGGCGLDTGGNCAIAAAVLWFVSSSMSCAAGKAPEEEGGSGDVMEEDAEKGGE